MVEITQFIQKSGKIRICNNLGLEALSAHIHTLMKQNVNSLNI